MYTEQDILDLAAQMKQQRIDAENAAIAKGFSDVSTGDLLQDLKDNMVSSYPGFKEARPNLMNIASDHVASVSSVNPLNTSDYTVNPVGCTASKASGVFGDGVQVTVTCPSTHSLPNAPMFYRVLIQTSNGSHCAWVMDPVS